jgi:hypothetical protein
MILLSGSESVDLQDKTICFRSMGEAKYFDKNLISDDGGVFWSFFPDSLHCEPDIFGSHRFPPRVGRQFQGLLSNSHSNLFHYFPQFFRRIIAYSTRTTLFYEPMHCSG